MAVASADISLKAAPPRARDAVQAQVHEARVTRADPESIAPDPSDETPRHPELAHQLLEVARPVRLDRDHHARRPFPEERQIGASARPRIPAIPMTGVGRTAWPRVSL